MYEIKHDDMILKYNPELLDLKVEFFGDVWEWKCDKLGLELYSGGFTDLHEGSCVSELFSNGVEKGVKAVYTLNNQIVVNTYVSVVTSTGDIRFRVSVSGDEYNAVKKLYWPAAFDFCPDNGYTVLPFMQGTLIPSKWPKELKQYADGMIFERDAYLPMWGQVKYNTGYIAIFETPYDANYTLDHTPGGATLIRPCFRPSLGRMAYEREIIISFIHYCDYNQIAKKYRKYAKANGKLMTLKQKIAKNENVAKLIGTPVVHSCIAVHIEPGTHYYNPDRPENNDHYVSFYKRAEELRKLKEKGVERVYLHLDGWGKRGYDNLHPDVFPPYENAGGAAGMKYLSDTCKELGYVFGIHDQYHDYYYNAESFDIENAIKDTFGESEYINFWYGGAQTLLCTKLAPYYIQRNYKMFKDYGIDIEGSYLDVFSIVGIRECAHKDHPMNRKESAEYRIKCFDVLEGEGIITSSEEPCDFILNSMALCHHAPFAVEEIGSEVSTAIGIPIPLFNLVYHECIVTPWWGLSGTGWNIPVTDWGFLHALLNGGTIYYDINESVENIELGKVALKLHEKVAFEELVSHEFLDNSYRKQKTVFANGIAVIVDFDSRTWEIIE